VGEGAILECVFERLTDQARTAVRFAVEEARLLGCETVDSEHLLLGVLRRGNAADIMRDFGVTFESARAVVLRLVGPREEILSGELPLSASAQWVLGDVALREALALGHNAASTEHILLALLRAEDSAAPRVLIELGVDAERVRAVVNAKARRGQASSLLGVPGLAAPVEVAPQAAPWMFGGWPRAVPSELARRVLMVASARALEQGRTEVLPSDLLLALTSDEHTKALLAQFGVDEKALRDAIDRGGEQPPEASAQG
jgi:ATP-dependent Clp protease ATP-binding subunit ClpC